MKLIAIDGNSLMHRAYYALPNMTNKAGTPTGALHGFLSMLLKLVDMRPDYLLVAFDMPIKTFRHEKYADYKAGRRETPDDLRTQFPLLQELLKKMGKRLDEHCFYVDAEYNLYPIPFVKTIAFLEKQVYCYRLGMETQSMNIRNMQKNCAHHEMVLTHLLEFYKEEAERLTPEKKAYVAEGVAKILTSQYKIYLSYPAEAVHKNQIVAWDKRIKKEFPDIYHSVTNRAVKMLRHSGYGLYRLASYLCRKAYGCD